MTMEQKLQIEATLKLYIFVVEKTHLWLLNDDCIYGLGGWALVPHAGNCVSNPVSAMQSGSVPLLVYIDTV